jgi:hypothetical protein
MALINHVTSMDVRKNSKLLIMMEIIPCYTKRNEVFFVNVSCTRQIKPKSTLRVEYNRWNGLPRQRGAN